MEMAENIDGKINGVSLAIVILIILVVMVVIMIFVIRLHQYNLHLVNTFYITLSHLYSNSSLEHAIR